MFRNTADPASPTSKHAKAYFKVVGASDLKLQSARTRWIVCGFTATGKENVPKKGPVVIVPNHKSFWDPFFVAIVLRRPVLDSGPRMGVDA